MSLILGNLVLVQCQGIVVGFLASLAGIAMGWIPIGKHGCSDQREMALERQQSAAIIKCRAPATPPSFDDDLRA